MDIYVRKKSGNLEEWDANKIIHAISESANRIASQLSDDENAKVIALVENQVFTRSDNVIPVETVHSLVEMALEEIRSDVAKSYKDYRNWIKREAQMNAKVTAECNAIQFLGDKSNSNADSSLVSTKRVKKLDILETAQYEEYFLNADERKAAAEGYIYPHDKGARLDTMNCCLCDIQSILTGGFEMGNVWYNEPKTIDTAFDVIGDITLMAASQQYGGFTLPEVDFILEPYAEKSYQRYYNEYLDIMQQHNIEYDAYGINLSQDANEYATKKVCKDIDQGFQGWEYKFNTVASSRGDYPFITATFGLNTSKWGKEISKSILRTRMNGQGKKGHKKPVLFPKLVFLYDENLHGPGKVLEDVFEVGIQCSAKTMYPDWLSLTGDGYVAEMYKKYGKVVSPMGCVDGKEIITYKYKNQLYVESFERMWKRLSDFFEPQYQILGQPHMYMNLLDVMIYDTEKGFVNTQKIIRNVSDKWIDVHLSNGRRLLCTEDHPFEVIEKGQIIAKNLQISDKIMINSNQYNEETIVFNKDKAWLLGFMLCDGCYQSNRIYVSIAAQGEDEIENKFHYVFSKYFDLKTKTILQERGKKGRYKDLVAIADENNNLQSTINYFTVKFGGINKINRHIPNEVFSWDYESKMAFLAGMIDADGYLNASSHGGSVVQIGSTNKELSLQQMALVQALGMPAKIYHNHYLKNNPNAIRYRVEFFATEELLNYIICEKKRQFYRDAVSSHYNTYAEIVEILPIERQMYSYDVTTDSEHFEVSGIYSHNCRAFLSPWYEYGGMYPVDENDKPVFVGRFNCGVVSLHLPMILAKSRRTGKDFYEELDYYLEMIRNIHKRTYEHLSHMKASMNPLGFCEGGFYGGHLDLNDKIAPVLKSSTASFGITALNELQRLYNGKSIVEDGQFALEVMEYINKKLDEYKKEDNILYAIYGTPAESLTGKQVTQFRKEFGIIENVSDREYVSNSFHCHVTEKITPIEKQNLENRFWNLFNGGKIQYVRYPIDYNIDSIKTLVRRAMKMGFYEGVNLSLAYCDDCGHQQLEMDVCPKCGSSNLTKIDRMNGYLSFSRVHGDTRLNKAKMAEISERISM